MFRAVLIACGLLAATAAHADERGCRPLESALDYLEQAGAEVAVFRDAATLDKALNFYAATPPVSPASKAGGILWISANGGPVALIFTDGVNACEVLRFNSAGNAELARMYIFGTAS